jgi:hypothetical protein
MITVRPIKYPAVCNGCGDKAAFFMKSNVLTMFLCKDCMRQHVRDCSTLVDGTGSFSTKKYMEALKAEQQNDDIEEAHANADGTLCNLLKDLGYGPIVEEYNKVSKWYA